MNTAMNRKEIIYLIRKRRKSLNINQKDLADIAGISLHSLSNIESGKGNPSLGLLTQLCDVLGLEIIVRVRGAE